MVLSTVLDLHGVVEGMRDLLQRMVGAGVRVRVETAGGPWPVWGSTSQLEQVLMNLAVNARDAMEGKGELLVRIERAEDAALGPVCRMIVTDTGAGMTDEVRRRIFEPFFTTKGPTHGTGLGLATVFGIASRLGGRVDVESSPGKGATFTLSLPLATGAAAAEGTAPPALASTAASVCVVDDEPGVRNVMARVLGAAGLAVRCFPSAEALLAEPDVGCDVLITDNNLPGMSGMALVEEVRRRRPGVRTVLVSGYTADPSAISRLVASGTAFVAKPFAAGALLAAATGAPPKAGASSAPASA